MPTDLIADYDPSWPAAFDELGLRLRRALGDRARRIDHIGSTAVPGLAAKPVIDVQISVACLDDVGAFRAAVESCGFVWRRDNPDLTKRYFRELPGAARTHVHVRAAGSFSEQAALLFRDYLRWHPARARDYVTLKRSLAPLLLTDRSAYVDAKSPFVWQSLRDADAWAQQTGWAPGPSDA